MRTRRQNDSPDLRDDLSLEPRFQSGGHLRVSMYDLQRMQIRQRLQAGCEERDDSLCISSCQADSKYPTFNT